MMKTATLKLTTHHPQGYRPGETSTVIGLVWVKPKKARGRPCLVILFEDGEVDYVPLESIGPNFELHR